MPAIRRRRDSNRLFRTNLAKGQTGLSVAFDLPTQTGYDADHPWRAAKSARSACRSPISATCGPLFEGIPLDRMNTSMTINATAAWLLALYVAVGRRAGRARAKRSAGTTQNDIIKEYLSRGTYVFPPAPSLRLITDTIAFSCRELPKWNPMNVCSYHLQEAGATPVQELSYALATAIAVLDARQGVAARSPRMNFRKSSGASPSSSMPASASSPKSARCAPSPNCGTRSAASAMASRTRNCAASAMACR